MIYKFLKIRKGIFLDLFNCFRMISHCINFAFYFTIIISIAMQNGMFLNKVHEFNNCFLIHWGMGKQILKHCEVRDTSAFCGTDGTSAAIFLRRNYR
jgi:hypothetical protein